MRPHLSQHALHKLIARKDLLAWLYKQIDAGHVRRVRHGKHHAIGMARRGHALAIKAHKGLTGLDMVALGNKQFKALATHLNGVDAHMDEELDAVIGGDAKGMRHGRAHRAGGRRIRNILVGPNGTARSKHTGGKHGVRHVAHRRNAPGDRCAQHNDASLFS